jgi:pimeloyl-ACP methyl ester carboxylesterase
MMIDLLIRDDRRFGEVTSGTRAFGSVQTAPRPWGKGISMQPETRYARSGAISIAYQVLGNGPRDLVLVPGWVSNVELFWEERGVARFLERLASFSRLILFDKRGTGLSDRIGDLPGIEVRMDDVRAVMDAVGSERATLLGYSEGGPMSALFAATYPARTEALIMTGSYPRLARAADFPWGISEEQLVAWMDTVEREWGGPVDIERRFPSVASDPRIRHWWARFLRMSATPTTAVALTKMSAEFDIRHVLPAVRVPTLILHSIGDRVIDIGASRYMAEHIPGAQLIELPGADHLPWFSDRDAILAEIELFLTGSRPAPEADRMLTTVLFTDIVGATEAAAAFGDRRWHDLLDSHHAAVRRELDRFRGREINTAGDAFLAIFDGPARAVRCASAISDAVQALGLSIRAGVHTGECEVMGGSLGGIAVHIGSRIAALAQAGEVLVSSTVKDLVAGSGLRFFDRGAQVLKGVPDEWRLFSVER